VVVLLSAVCKTRNLLSTHVIRLLLFLLSCDRQRNVNKLELDDVVCNSEAVTMATFAVYSAFSFFGS
jgi:hypothetical protein